MMGFLGNAMSNLNKMLDEADGDDEDEGGQRRYHAQTPERATARPSRPVEEDEEDQSQGGVSAFSAAIPGRLKGLMPKLLEPKKGTTETHDSQPSHPPPADTTEDEPEDDVTVSHPSWSLQRILPVVKNQISRAQGAAQGAVRAGRDALEGALHMAEADEDEEDEAEKEEQEAPPLKQDGPTAVPQVVHVPAEPPRSGDSHSTQPPAASNPNPHEGLGLGIGSAWGVEEAETEMLAPSPQKQEGGPGGGRQSFLPLTTAPPPPPPRSSSHASNDAVSPPSAVVSDTPGPPLVHPVSSSPFSAPSPSPFPSAVRATPPSAETEKRRETPPPSPSPALFGESSDDSGGWNVNIREELEETARGGSVSSFPLQEAGLGANVGVGRDTSSLAYTLTATHTDAERGVSQSDWAPANIGAPSGSEIVTESSVTLFSATEAERDGRGDGGNGRDFSQSTGNSPFSFQPKSSSPAVPQVSVSLSSPSQEHVGDGSSETAGTAREASGGSLQVQQPAHARPPQQHQSPLSSPFAGGTNSLTDPSGAEQVSRENTEGDDEIPSPSPSPALAGGGEAEAAAEGSAIRTSEFQPPQAMAATVIHHPPHAPTQESHQDGVPSSSATALGAPSPMSGEISEGGAVPPRPPEGKNSSAATVDDFFGEGEEDEWGVSLGAPSSSSAVAPLPATASERAGSLESPQENAALGGAGEMRGNAEVGEADGGSELLSISGADPVSHQEGEGNGFLFHGGDRGGGPTGASPQQHAPSDSSVPPSLSPDSLPPRPSAPLPSPDPDGVSDQQRHRDGIWTTDPGPVPFSQPRGGMHQSAETDREGEGEGGEEDGGLSGPEAPGGGRSMRLESTVTGLPHRWGSVSASDKGGRPSDPQAPWQQPDVPETQQLAGVGGGGEDYPPTPLNNEWSDMGGPWASGGGSGSAHAAGGPDRGAHTPLDADGRRPSTSDPQASEPGPRGVLESAPALERDALLWGGDGGDSSGSGGMGPGPGSGPAASSVRMHRNLGGDRRGIWGQSAFGSPSNVPGGGMGDLSGLSDDPQAVVAHTGGSCTYNGDVSPPPGQAEQSAAGDPDLHGGGGSAQPSSSSSSPNRWAAGNVQQTSIETEGGGGGFLAHTDGDGGGGASPTHEPSAPFAGGTAGEFLRPRSPDVRSNRSEDRSERDRGEAESVGPDLGPQPVAPRPALSAAASSRLETSPARRGEEGHLDPGQTPMTSTVEANREVETPPPDPSPSPAAPGSEAFGLTETHSPRGVGAAIRSPRLAPAPHADSPSESEPSPSSVPAPPTQRVPESRIPDSSLVQREGADSAGELQSALARIRELEARQLEDQALLDGLRSSAGSATEEREQRLRAERESENLREELGAVRKEAEETQARYLSQLQSLRSEKDSLESQKRQAEKDAEGWKDVSTVSESELALIKKDLEREKAKLQELYAELNSTMAENGQLKDIQQRTEREITQLKSALDETLQEQKSSQQRLRSLESAVQKAEEEKRKAVAEEQKKLEKALKQGEKQKQEELEAEMASILSGKDSQMSRLKESLEKQSASVRQKEKETQAAHAELLKTKEQLSAAEEKMKKLQEHSEREHERLISECEKRVRELEGQITGEAGIQEGIEDSERSLREDLLKVEAQKRDAEEEKERLRRQVEEERDKYEALYADLASSQGLVESLQRDVETAAARGAETAREEVGRLREELREASRRAEDAEAKRAEAQARQSVFETQTEGYRSEAALLKKEVDRLEDKVKTLTAATASPTAFGPGHGHGPSFHMPHQAFEEIQAKHQQDMASRQRIIDEKDARIQALSAERATLKVHLDEVKAELACFQDIERGGGASPDAGLRGRGGVVALGDAGAGRGAGFAQPGAGGAGGADDDPRGLLHGDAHSAFLARMARFAGVLREIDEPLRKFTRLLYKSFPIRLVFFAYVLFVQLFLFLILHFAGPARDTHAASLSD
uniref:Uncharacterized protein n=1 Tax=Chromera velia CCMP2878 TaxID=1169474 RepID=A0A0G4FPD4_9ALVE|eukprot:Cvel_3592.t1-p1 / transcript=Cvel_3592.t1 / gene=Cvel_3592 / organism=Chromera_velia_CCMP2878 / gene_product=Early endosome antigen 1, putative / transcript_product=Early endosome antigen 1, putative / location=Cvel_scaffold147:37971-50869(+) / protein_length=1950 / sequence_SO=supercontig / SO=protein_coding / is_pseudo=false